MYLIDTSAWIAHFSKKDPFELQQICPADQRVLCLPVYQEILQGIKEEVHFRSIREILDAAQHVEETMEKPLYVEAALLYRSARRQGLPVRSAIDCLIAVCAIRHNLVVLHRDRDYPFLARVSPLRQRPI